MFAVVGEYEEGSAVRFHTTVKLHTVCNRRHRVFADTEMDISARGVACREIAVNVVRRVFHIRKVGGRNVAASEWQYEPGRYRLPKQVRRGQ